MICFPQEGDDHMSIDFSQFELFVPVKHTKEELKKIKKELKELNRKNKRKKASK
jgi:hypothetical protein